MVCRPLAVLGLLAILAACSTTGTVPVVPYPQDVKVAEKVVPADRCSFLQPQEDSLLGSEEYVIKVSRRGAVSVWFGGAAGLKYAASTLSQEIEKDGGLHPGTIHDYPRYEWRGFMLDEARHFSGIDRVKMLLDEMSRLKMNVFHWHLTDAQGWRIQIDAYPKLTTVGGIGTHSDIYAPAQYYTKDQIREIVQYAAERCIQVVPEIDMPGHVSALCKAYPEFGGGGVSAGFPNFTLNVGKEETYAMLEKVLGEVAGLFPSEYIMIGGDEVSYGSYAWLANKDISALMKREGYTDVLQAEACFIRRLQGIISGLGKTMMGWDDIIDFVEPDSGAAMMWWRHDKPERLRQLLAGDVPTILCPRKPMYFDFVQHDDHQFGRKWDGFCPIEDVYAFPDAWYEQWGVTETDFDCVMGVQSNLWTELVHNMDRQDFLVFPRIFATAEAAWTLPENKNYDNFRERLQAEYARMDAAGICYYDYRDPAHHPEPEGPVLGDRPAQKQNYRDWQ